MKRRGHDKKKRVLEKEGRGQGQKEVENEEE